MSEQKIDRPALLQLLRESFQKIQAHLQDYDAAQLFELEQADKWSAAGHLQHLIQSNASIASEFKEPKNRLSAFGKPAQPETNYQALRARYTKGVVGVKAPASLQPQLTPAATIEPLFQNWQMILHKFEQRLANWTEEELDQYTIPHPFLGALSARQMLYFALFHNEHHLNSIRRIQAKQQA
ncbi:MAG: DinB family protein [Bacteroidota bacterium]